MTGIHGGEIYDKNIRLDFSVSLNPLGCPESVKRAVFESFDDIAYYPDITNAALRKKIAEYEQERYHDLTSPEGSEMIVPGSGASEIITAVSSLFAGRRILIYLPVFSGYERAFINAGCDISYIYPHEYDLAPERIAVFKPDLVVTGSPVNPTGAVIPQDILEKTVSACGDAGSYLLCDEAFMGFVSERKKCTLARFFKDRLKLIIVRSFTKLYSCPGLRIGYAVCSDQDTAGKIKQHLPEWNISCPAERAVLALCGEGAFADKSAEFVCKERCRLVKEMESMGLYVYPSDCNYIFFKADAGLYEWLLKKGILIRKCDNYKGIGGPDHYRIGIKQRSDNDLLLEELKTFKMS